MARTAQTTHPSASTTQTIRTDLSLLYRIVRVVIKPFRPRLVKSVKPVPAGSPRLLDRPGTKRGCRIKECKDGELWLYELTPKSYKGNKTNSRLTDSKHRVLYFAGGGWQAPPSGHHWAFICQIAACSELKDSHAVTIVSYPLAPISPASECLPMLQDYLRREIEACSEHKQKLTLMGDSAGGTIVACLAFWWAEELVSMSGENMKGQSTADKSSLQNLSGILTNTILISPSCDQTLTNPAMNQIDKLDPLLGMSMTERCARAWTAAPPLSSHPAHIKSIRRADPSVSPGLSSQDAYRALKSSGINVHGMVATHDVIAPDTMLFRDKCFDLDIPGQWLVWEGQMHCFALAGVYGLPEGREAMGWCKEVLKSYE